jgi:hypothetical protein
MLKSHPRSLQCFPGLTGDSPMIPQRCPKKKTLLEGKASSHVVYGARLWDTGTSHRWNNRNSAAVHSAVAAVVWSRLPTVTSCARFTQRAAAACLYPQLQQHYCEAFLTDLQPPPPWLTCKRRRRGRYLSRQQAPYAKHPQFHPSTDIGPRRCVILQMFWDPGP